jgi:hypothetical protein
MEAPEEAPVAAVEEPVLEAPIPEPAPPMGTSPVVAKPLVLPDAPLGDIPIYAPGMALPVSALDGYVFDDLPSEGQQVLDAIAQINTESIEQEAQVFEAMEVITPMAHIGGDELLEETEAPPMPSSPTHA